MRAWEASLDRRLVARLMRPIVRPGMIHMALARRILADFAAMTERLPLLARFGGRRELVVTTPILHARWMPPAPVEATMARSNAPPTVLVAPGRTLGQVIKHVSASTVPYAPAATTALERTSAVEPSRSTATSTAGPIAPGRTIERVGEHAPALTATREPTLTATREPVRTATREPTLTATHAPAVAAREAASSRTDSTAPAIVPAQVASDVSAALPEPRPDGSHASTPVPGHSAAPVIRRSRVGAPLPARPQIASRSTERPVPDPARAIVVPSAPTLAPSPATPAPSTVLPAREPRTRAASASATIHVRPRTTVVDLHTSAGLRSAATLVVATRTPRKPPIVEPPVPTPVVVAAARPDRPRVERRAMPAVRPDRTGDGERARVTELPLAQPLPAAAPPAIARPLDPTPVPIASPRPIVEAATPPAPALPKIDLHGLAEQVQRILVRQAEHTRARQGLQR
jgi:hypothetical protein